MRPPDLPPPSRDRRPPGWRRAGPAAGLLALLLLQGCGFSPLYRGGGDGAADPVRTFASVEIAPIADRSGQLLRNALRDRLTPRGRPAAPAHRLTVTLTEHRSDLVIRPDSASTLAKMRLTARFVLVSTRTGAPVLRGKAQSTTIFNIIGSAFANLSAERAARRRAAVELADQIRLRLATHFRGTGDPAAGPARTPSGATE